MNICFSCFLYLCNLTENDIEKMKDGDKSMFFYDAYY